MFTKIFSLPTTAILISTLASLTSCQLSLPSTFPTELTPSFTPAFDISLLFFSSNQTISTSTSGELVTISDAADPPALVLSSPLPATIANPLLLIMLDPDAPTPESPNRITILHALQPSLTPSQLDPLQLTSTVEAVAPYRGPGPPAGSPPHRYVFLFYEQPSTFALPADFNATQRAGFDLASFVTATGLGEPVAGVFFTSVRDSTDVPAAPVTPNPSTPNTPTPVQLPTPIFNNGTITTGRNSSASGLPSGIPSTFGGPQGWNSTNPPVGGGRNGTRIGSPGAEQTGGLVIAPPVPSAGFGAFGGEVGSVEANRGGQGFPQGFDQGSGSGKGAERVWWTLYGGVAVGFVMALL